jgi:hypothetical protein
MQQSKSLVLEYHKPESSGAIGYWTSTGESGRETKYVRVFCGLALPQLDRQGSALICLGELFRSFAPAAFHGLSAATGSWPEIKTALLQVCRDLKPERIIVQDEPSRKLVFPITDSLIGAPVVPSCYAAPAHATTELGRQNVELLINEDRLHIGHLLDVLDSEKDPSDKALRCAVNWALDHPAFYPGKPRPQPKYKRVLGTEGL